MDTSDQTVNELFRDLVPAAKKLLKNGRTHALVIGHIDIDGNVNSFVYGCPSCQEHLCDTIVNDVPEQRVPMPIDPQDMN